MMIRKTSSLRTVLEDSFGTVIRIACRRAKCYDPEIPASARLLYDTMLDY
jgi:hypothetical protein